MAANQVDFKILPSDQFSVYSPATRSDKVITYFTLLSKLRGDILSVGQDDDPNNIVSAFYSSVGGTQTLHLVKADGSEVTASVPEPTVGTVTSVDLTASTGISVSGGPITTSGSITVTNTAPDQVVVLTGAGTTSISGTYPSFTITSNDQFVGTVTSVGLTMPAAFSVANSPVTTSGTLAVTAAGLSSQYIRGDGQLANFPTPGGGGSSVNYYLNGSVSQGTFGGDTYYELSKAPIAGAGTNFTRAHASGDGYVASFITDANDPDQINIPGGNWNLEFYFNSSSSGGAPAFYGELYKVSISNVFTLIASGSVNPESITGGTSVDQYYTSIAVPQTALLATDRLAIRVYVIVDGRNITLHTENSNFSEVITTFSTGLNSLNGLSDQVQYFAVGTSGTDFAISSSVDTHTFNLPTASATNRGALSSADWTTFNSKEPALTKGNLTEATSAVLTITGGTGAVIGTGTTIQVAQAGVSTSGFLSSTDWNTFNGKQNAITLTTTGSTGAATLIGATLNIPNYADQFVGTVTSVDLTAGTGITVSGGPITTSGSITVTNNDRGSSQNIFKNIAVAGQSTIVADVNDDTLTVVAGSGVTITTNDTTDTITISATGSGGSVTSVGTSAPITGGTITTTGTIGITQSGAAADGYLSSTDWNTFNNKQNALTNPVTGTGTTNYVSKFTSSSAIGNSSIFDDGNVGIGTALPAYKLDVDSGSGQIAARFYNSSNVSTVVYIGDTGNSDFSDLILQSNSGTGEIFKAGTVYSSYGGTLSLNIYNSNGAIAFHPNNTANAMFIATDTKVGIGNTGPSEKLHVTGNIRVTGAYYDSANAAGTSGQILSSTGTGTSWIAAPSGGGISGSGTANYVTKWTSGSAVGNSVMYDDGTYVGINTTTPTLNTSGRVLHINAPSNQASIVHFTNATTGALADDGLIVGRWDDGINYLFTYENEPLYFGTNSSIRMVIASAGNVLIGTTVDNSYKLRVSGKGYFDNNVVITPTSESWAEGLSFVMPTSTTWGGIRWRRERVGDDGNWYIGFTALDATDDLVFGANNGGAQVNNIIRLTKAGNVGIGTTNPTAKLYIEGGSANWNETTPGLSVGTIHLDPGVTTNDFGNAITFGASDSDSGIYAQAGIYVRSDGAYGTKMYFATTDLYATGSQTRMYISEGGNVGIGTTGASYKLDINGVTRFQDIVRFKNDAWNLSDDGKNRFYFTPNGRTYFGSFNGYEWRNSADGAIAVITDAGNVGINTTNPLQRLHVVGAVVGGNTGSTGLPNPSGVTTQLAFEARSTAGGNDPSIAYHKEAVYTMYLQGQNSPRGLRLYSPTGETTANFYVQGDVVAFSSSDRRLKDNLSPIPNALDKVSKLTGYEFDWNENQSAHSGHDYGVVAQEVEAVLPELVQTREDGYKAVKYDKIVAVLIEAIKEQQKQIDELKSKLK